MIPQQMLTAILLEVKLPSKEPEAVEAWLAERSLKQIADIRGVGRKLVAEYAMESGRQFDLFETGWKVAGIDREKLEVEYLYEKLLEAYETDTLNDRINLKRLAELYVDRRLLKESGEPDYRAASDLDGAIIALERHLEIDPKTRTAQEGQEDPSTIIQELVDKSATYMDEEGFILATPHGPVGYGVIQFKRSPFIPRCGECGSEHLVFTSPWDGQVYDAVLVSDEQRARYVAGRDFVPEGAPNMPLFEEEKKSPPDLT